MELSLWIQNILGNITHEILLDSSYKTKFIQYTIVPIFNQQNLKKEEVLICIAL